MNAKPLITPTLTGLLAVLLAGTAAAGLFSPKGESADEQRKKVREERDEILARLYSEHPEAKAEIENAAGYGAFNNKNMNLFLLSTGHGYGMVVDKKTGKETFMAMGSLGGGAGMGAKDLSVVFIFENTDVMKEFVDKGWQFGGEIDATAKAGDEGDAVAKEAKAAGIAEKTLRRAKSQLKVKVTKTGFHGSWCWALPGAEAAKVAKWHEDGQAGPKGRDGHLRDDAAEAADLDRPDTVKVVVDRRGVEPSIREAIFNVTSIISGTGYASVDYQEWGSFAATVFFFLGLIGGCAGSTSCSVKIFRYQILVAAIRAEIRRIQETLGVTTLMVTHDQEEAMFMGDRIAVIGAGTLGCLAARLATRIPGCRVELIDINPRRYCLTWALKAWTCSLNESSWAS